MNQGRVRTRTEALVDASSSLQAFEAASAGALDLFAVQLDRALKRVEREVASRRRNRNDAESELANAADRDRPSALRSVERTRASEAQADDVLDSMERLADEFFEHRRRFLRVTADRVDRGRKLLRVLSAEVQQYGTAVGLQPAAVRVGVAAQADDDGVGGHLGGLLEAKGLALVDVADATWADNPVTSYAKANRSDYSWAVERWDAIVRPLLERGGTREDLEAQDGRAHAPPLRRLADVHDLMLGSEQIVVEPRAGGGWEVINGRHRLEAARQCGVKQLPARIHSGR